MITTSRITGHLAMFQASMALEPTPSTLPALFARPPVKVTAMATATSITSRTSVVTTRVGSVFHTGRPSPMS